MRGVASLERRLLVKCVGLVEGGAAVVVAAGQRHVLRGEVVLGFGARQSKALQRPAQLLQAALARVQSSHRLVGHVHVVRLGRQGVHHRVYRLALAAQVFLSVR